jgi:hypothetical protein
LGFILNKKENLMKIIYRNLVIPLLVLAMLFTVTLETACPSESAIQKSAKASNQLANLTLEAVRTTKTAYESNLITIETKDRIATKLVTLSKGGIAFNTSVRELQSVYRNSGIPPDKFQVLSALFDTSVISPFLSILQDLGVLKNAPSVLAAIEVIRIAVLTIASVFGKTSINLHRAVSNYG